MKNEAGWTLGRGGDRGGGAHTSSSKVIAEGEGRGREVRANNLVGVVSGIGIEG